MHVLCVCFRFDIYDPDPVSHVICMNMNCKQICDRATSILSSLLSVVLFGDSNFMTYDVCQILTQSILIEMFRTFGCLEKLDCWRSANGYKDHASQKSRNFPHKIESTHNQTHQYNNSTQGHIQTQTSQLSI